MNREKNCVSFFCDVSESRSSELVVEEVLGVYQCQNVLSKPKLVVILLLFPEMLHILQVYNFLL